MKKTLYLTDLDGTLLGNDAKLSAYTADILRRLLRAGGLFTCATARSPVSARPVLAGLPLALPIAAYNGAFIAPAAAGTPVDVCILEQACLEDLRRAIQGGARPLVYALHGGAERVSWLKGEETPCILNYLADRRGDPRLNPVDNAQKLLAGQVYQIIFMGPQAEMARLEKQVTGSAHLSHHLQQDTYHPEEHWLEIMRHDGTKADAVRKLKAIAGADEVVCFGDNNNDIPMFKAADRGYAVANACSALKAVATGVIAANSEDGVARWLVQNTKIA